MKHCTEKEKETQYYWNRPAGPWIPQKFSYRPCALPDMDAGLALPLRKLCIESMDICEHGTLCTCTVWSDQGFHKQEHLITPHKCYFYIH